MLQSSEESLSLSLSLSLSALWPPLLCRRHLLAAAARRVTDSVAASAGNQRAGHVAHHWVAPLRSCGKPLLGTRGSITAPKALLWRRRKEGERRGRRPSSPTPLTPLVRALCAAAGGIEAAQARGVKGADLASKLDSLMKASDDPRAARPTRDAAMRPRALPVPRSPAPECPGIHSRQAQAPQATARLTPGPHPPPTRSATGHAP